MSVVDFLGPMALATLGSLGKCREQAQRLRLYLNNRSDLVSLSGVTQEVAILGEKKNSILPTRFHAEAARHGEGRVAKRAGVYNPDVFPQMEPSLG